MRKPTLFGLVVLPLVLAACTGQVPTSPDQVKAALTQVGQTTSEQAQALQQSADAAKTTLSSIGEATQAAGDRTAEMLTSAGESTLSVADTAKAALESVGNTVLEVTGTSEPSSN
jgi:methyl-accepting chemotaxis protein